MFLAIYFTLFYYPHNIHSTYSCFCTILHSDASYNIVTKRVIDLELHPLIGTHKYLLSPVAYFAYRVINFVSGIDFLSRLA